MPDYRYILSREVCICAAIRAPNGVIVRGHRHFDCIQTMTKMQLSVRGHIQGFVTSVNRFVDCQEAMTLQLAAGVESVRGYRGDILFSDDLY